MTVNYSYICGMEVKVGKKKKFVIRGKMICLVGGVLSAICGFYWIYEALFYDKTDLPAILSSICCSLFLTVYGMRK